MALRCFIVFFFFTIFALAILPSIQGEAVSELHDRSFHLSSSPFSTALEDLQTRIRYTFKSVGLLRRAMTHSSFSEENNRALSVLGANVIETSVSLHYLQENIDISAEDLSVTLTEITKVETSCAKYGTKLGLQKVIRVSHKTNSSVPSVVCGAFRAIFGAIAVDTGKSDDAGNVFLAVHGEKDVGALAS